MGPADRCRAAATGSTDDRGALVLHLRDHAVGVAMAGVIDRELPVGPVTLAERLLDGSDPPQPADLTNALGLVHDHFDDIVVESPTVLSASSLAATGRHAIMLARVELGRDDVPAGYRLQRRDADEVFRTLVAEPVAQRQHNPGLRPDHARSIVGTCCVILAIMRRLDSPEIGIEPAADEGT